ncbi:MAG: hypothetical protein K0S70_1786 [Microbacterium sp.]|nr:hypothetical protein [Microbacterium sp.]
MTGTRNPVAQALDTRGFILDDGSALALAARAIWNHWWQRHAALTFAQARLRLDRVCAQRRPQVSPSFKWAGSSRISVGAMAWLRNDHVVTTHPDFPYHHSIPESADYLRTWSRSEAEGELEAADWSLWHRPGGWVGTVGDNGNHRSLLAAAVGVPLVRVRLTDVYTWHAEPASPGAEIRLEAPRWSWQARAITRFSRHGLCVSDEWKRGEGPLDGVSLRRIDPLLPWIFDRRRRDVRTRFKHFCERFGYRTDGDWRMGANALAAVPPS